MTTSKAKLEANKRYLDKQDEIRIRIPKGEKERIKNHAAEQGESMNFFIIRAINETIQKDHTKK